MDSLQQSMTELSNLFNSRMNSFQRDLKAASPASSPSSNIHAQFQEFRTFVLSALESLQLQINILSRNQDALEMRSRRKILLVHGVAEDRKEDIVSKTLNILTTQLKLADISRSAISRCHRLGSSTNSKTRAILVRFYETKFRDKCWSHKSGLKGSGITLSEFLTKPRHDAFIMARKQFGVTNCWTSDGMIIVVGGDGVRHRAASVSEVSAIQGACTSVASVLPTASVTATSKDSKSLPIVRSKRLTKK